MTSMHARPSAIGAARLWLSLGRVAILLPLAFLLILWLWIVAQAAIQYSGPAGVGMGSDFAAFYSAARLVQRGANPYDPKLVYQTEIRVLRHHGIPISTNRAWVRVGNPPLLYWSLQPLARLPFRLAAWIWVAGLACVAAAGAGAALLAAGWRRRMLPVLVFLAMPQVLLGYFNGDVSPVVFAGLAAGLVNSRRHPFAAGLVLTLAWLKPSVAFPFVLLILLFHTANWKRTMGGLTAATAALLLLDVAVLGPSSLAAWVHGLPGFSQTIAAQPEIAPLSAVYVRRAPPDLRMVLEVASLVAAVAATAWWWRKRRGRQENMLATGWLWFVRFLATPYAHINDVILLTPPVLAMLGADGYRATRALPAAVLYLLFASVLASPISIPLEPLELTAAGLCLAVASQRTGYREEMESRPVPSTLSIAIDRGSLP